ncbi:MAG: hypothetical protein C4542_02945 [Dehalococcoidia bacterium]|nr:MAG: hypothetical protein C4542_02945 [Dehalococcoidia bacterium]
MKLTKKQAARFNELQALGYESCALPPEEVFCDPKNLLCRRNYGNNTQYAIITRTGIIIARKTVWHEKGEE